MTGKLLEISGKNPEFVLPQSENRKDRDARRRKPDAWNSQPEQEENPQTEWWLCPFRR
jgi:hypothetical protein